MTGSFYGRWAIGHRYQAHIGVPAMGIGVMIVLYFFGNLPMQALVAPGFYELPFAGSRKAGLGDLVKVFCLLWILVLSAKTLLGSRDLEVKLLMLVYAVVTLVALALWVDGSSLTARLYASLGAAGESQQLLGKILAERASWVSIGLFSLFAFFCFMFIPLLYGGGHHPVRAMLVPSRWMALTALLMFLVLYAVFGLQAEGWGEVQGVEGALGPDMTLFVSLVFHYMCALYLAQLNYLAAVRHAAEEEALHLI